MAPPRKKARVSNNVKGQASLTSIADVCPVRLCLRDWIGEVYSLRHGLSEETKRAWPVEDGGSFQMIVARCWNDMDTLLADSLKFLKSVGMADDAADVSFLQEKWFKMKDGGIE